jgi:hypothetical protein
MDRDNITVCPGEWSFGVDERSRNVGIFSGIKPTGAKVSSPVVWMARGRETELWESIDETIVRMAVYARSMLKQQNQQEGTVWKVSLEAGCGKTRLTDFRGGYGYVGIIRSSISAMALLDKSINQIPTFPSFGRKLRFSSNEYSVYVEIVCKRARSREGRFACVINLMAPALWIVAFERTMWSH